MAAHHVDLPEQVVTPGEELWVKIIDIDLQRRRISLSIKQAAEGGEVSEEYREAFGEHAYDEEGNYIGFDYAEGEFTPETEAQAAWADFATEVGTQVHAPEDGAEGRPVRVARPPARVGGAAGEGRDAAGAAGDAAGAAEDAVATEDAMATEGDAAHAEAAPTTEVVAARRRACRASTRAVEHRPVRAGRYLLKKRRPCPSPCRPRRPTPSP